MKKWIFLCLLLPVAFCFAGCGEAKIENLMSEQTTQYYYGSSSVGQCTISVGQREEPYIVEGCHGQITDFALVVFNPTSPLSTDKIEVEICVDGKNQMLSLELNPLNMSYMADLGHEISGEVSVCYQDQSISLCRVSDEFNVGYNKAIKIGFVQAIDGLSIDKQKTKYEGYLKIVDGSKFGQSGNFWCFTLVCEGGESKNILISTMDENIILS